MWICFHLLLTIAYCITSGPGSLSTIYYFFCWRHNKKQRILYIASIQLPVTLLYISGSSLELLISEALCLQLNIVIVASVTIFFI